MDLPQLVTSIVRWIRAGHPEGLPIRAYVPLLALLPLNPTAEEITPAPDHRTEPHSAGYQSAQG